MVTAHHVIDGLDLDADDELRVGFGGSCTGGFNVNCDGLWVQDDSSNVEEENPLLGNRLFQLGLRWWARKPIHPGYTDAKLARDTLRSWPFELDDLDNQPFGRSDSRRDIAILKALENKNFRFEASVESDPYYTRTRPFMLDKPAIFFGRLPFKDYSDRPANGSDPTQLYGLHSNTWPDDIAEKYVPLISNPGYTDATSVNCANHDDSCTQDSSGAWNQAAQTDYEHCISTTLDGRSGTSGGAMTYQRTDFSRSAFLGLGVAQGCLAPEGEDCKLWSTQHTVIPERPDDVYQSNFTVTDSEVERWADRDDSYATTNPDPFNPLPHQPADDGDPECTGGENVDTGLCNTFSAPAQNDVWGTPPDAAKIPLAHNDGSEDDDAFKETHRRRYACDYSAFADLGPQMRTHAGIAYGFMGAATDAELNSDTLVGSLAIICGPWSSASWTDNWRWLMLNGRAMKPGYDATIDFHPRTMLETAMRRRYELRRAPNDLKTYPRPVSMKMCPPNYYLNGVHVYVNDGKLAGFQALQCRSPRGETHVESLQAPTSKYGGYTFNGHTYDLDQHIGNLGQGTFEVIACDDPKKPAVMGYVGSGQSDNAITGFWLECGPQPKP